MNFTVDGIRTPDEWIKRFPVMKSKRSVSFYLTRSIIAEKSREVEAGEEAFNLFVKANRTNIDYVCRFTIMYKFKTPEKVAKKIISTLTGARVNPDGTFSSFRYSLQKLW